MLNIHLSKRTKQTLLALLFLGAIALTFFATKATAATNTAAPVPRFKPSVYDNYVKAKPAKPTTTTTTTTLAPVAPKRVAPPITAPPVQQATGDVWEALANCESGGRWDYNGPSGYDGGLQFSPATWTRLHTHFGANTGYEFAWQAPKEVQIQVAVLNMQVSSGTHSQWPVCSRKVGMPNKF